MQGLALLLAVVALSGMLAVGVPPVAPAAPLAQATATPTATNTPTATPTPLAALNWERTDHPDGVRCYRATFNGQPWGGCVVIAE
jgi:hypothetical protein